MSFAYGALVNAEPYLTLEQAAAYTGLAKQTLYNLRKHIPKAKAVRKLLFRREDLDAFLHKRRKLCGTRDTTSL